MRTFIVSDLHGCGSIYDSIIKYLENINSRDGEDVEYISYDSLFMLLDVKKELRIKETLKYIILLEIMNYYFVNQCC